MITTNDLFDLYYSFVLIRYDIRYELNPQILAQLSETLKCECNEDNLVRKSLASLIPKNSDKWNFVFFNNFYTYRELIKDEYTIRLLVNICVILKELLELKNYEKAYDLVDAIHYIPILIQKNEKITNKKARKILKNYTQKWGKLDL